MASQKVATKPSLQGCPRSQDRKALKLKRRPALKMSCLSIGQLEMALGSGQRLFFTREDDDWRFVFGTHLKFSIPLPSVQAESSTARSEDCDPAAQTHRAPHPCLVSLGHKHHYLRTNNIDTGSAQGNSADITLMAKTRLCRDLGPVLSLLQAKNFNGALFPFAGGGVLYFGHFF